MRVWWVGTLDLHVDGRACCGGAFNRWSAGCWGGGRADLSPHFLRVVGIMVMDGGWVGVFFGAVVAFVWNSFGFCRVLRKMGLYPRGVYEALCLEEGNT